VTKAASTMKRASLRRRPRILTDDKAKPQGDEACSRIKVQIVLPDGSRLGPGKIMLLETIHSEGSLVRAARKLKISYRHAWLYMQQINKAFSEAAVHTPNSGHGGGPSQLSKFGKDLITQYRALEREARSAGARQLEWLDRHRADKGAPE
jgi:molybdate transport system regulatory protein